MDLKKLEKNQKTVMNGCYSDDYKIVWFTCLTDITGYINRNAEVHGTKKEKFIKIGSGFDTETSKITEKYSITYLWQLSIDKTIILCRDIDLLSLCLSQISNMLHKLYKKSKLIVWVANISFDFSMVKNYLKSYITKVFAKSKRRILSFEFNENILFRECLGVFASSLEEVAKRYTKTQKLVDELDYSLIRTPETELEKIEIQYSINDVAILSELTPVAFEMYLEQGKKIPLTQTGIVRNEIKEQLDFWQTKELKQQNLTYTGNRNMYKTLRKYLYSGGLTHSYMMAVGNIYNNVSCKDLTSAYPWALATQSFPCGRLLKCKTPELMMSKKHWFSQVMIKDLESFTGHSIISKHKVLGMKNPVIDNGRILSAEYVKLWINEVDFENIKSIYHGKIKFIHCYCFTGSYRTPQFITDVMFKYYKLKQVLKIEGKTKTKEYKIAKAMVNSIYGMLVTQMYETEMIFNSVTGELSEGFKDWEKVNTTIFNPFLGYWCTAYVRNRLVQCISKFPEHVLQYDTDSIYHTENEELETFIDDINAKIATENNELIEDELCRDLGLWSKDEKYKTFMPMGSKRYLGTDEHGEHHITFAGAKAEDIEKECKRLNMDIYTYMEGFSIEADASTKLVATYFDDTFDDIVTDYKGNKCRCIQHGGVTLVNATFNAHIAEEYFEMQTRYKEFFGVI